VAGRSAVESAAQETGAYLLIGSDQVERGDARPKLYNAAFLVRPDGRTAGVYRKMHLVPFGEYVPFERLLFFAAPLVESVSAFSPGDEAAVLPIAGGLVSTAICYEVVYPALMREFVVNGSQLLTTITNDAWYGRSSAPQQHFVQAAMRAIEEGRYLARAANTGISGFVDPYGRVLQASELFEQTALVADVRLLPSRTPYSRFGDWFVHLCTAVTAAAALAARRARRSPWQ
jgi:apolipoprotein N-acyltransferase